jgi:hypothetical protein
MNFQYYENLQDKSKKYLLYLNNQIVPKFSVRIRIQNQHFSINLSKLEEIMKPLQIYQN